MLTAEVLRFLAQVAGPRVERTRTHPLVSSPVIALLAVLCEVGSFTGIAAFGRSKRGFLATPLDLEGGILSHGTFGRVLAVLVQRHI